MERFIKAGKNLINVEQLLAVQHQEGRSEGVFREDEHYLVTFSTGQKIKLTPDEGIELLAYSGFGGVGKGSEDVIARSRGSVESSERADYVRGG